MNLHLVVDITDFQPSTSPLLQGYPLRVSSLPVHSGDSFVPTRAVWVLVELTLPCDECLALVQRLAQLHRGVGIIASDAQRFSNYGVEAYELGADVFRSEMLTHEELVAIARALIKRLPQSLHSGRQASPERLMLDAVRRELRGPIGTVHLAGSQCRLLLGFAMAVDFTLGRLEIQNILGYGDDIKRNLSVPLGRLRRQLTQAGADPKSIISLRSRGYQLICALRIK